MATSPLIIKKLLRAPAKEIFEAWTKPELMQKWFFPGDMHAKTTNELKVGGSYKHEMFDKDGETYVHEGTYEEITPHTKLVFTWNSPIVKDSKVTVELNDMGETTELTVTHELLPTEEVREKHNGGWNGCLENLERFMSS